MQWISVPSPIGALGVAADEGEITAIHFGGVGRQQHSGGVGRQQHSGGVGRQQHSGGVGRQPVAADPAPVLRRAKEQLDAYFAGELTEFDLPLAAPSGPDYEKAVWKVIATIGYGDMMTYGEIATALGDPTAARAVGMACNHNPVPIVVPCHRVVGAGGKLVGFGGGLDRKRHLLALEARVRVERDFSSFQ